jgi:hypothetical protein
MKIVEIIEAIDLDLLKAFQGVSPSTASSPSAVTPAGDTATPAAGVTTASAEGSPNAGYFTIGDSHAVAVATAGGKGWTNLAINGKSSTDSGMLSNISKIPKGSVVLVSQGANDTANAMRASAESKKSPTDPKIIAANVANVVSKVEAQGAKVIFMLFPNGPGRGAGLAKYYGGDYQEAVRSAIKSSLSVPIIDINGKPLTDGVHATMAVYKDVANQVRSSQQPKVSKQSNTPAGKTGVGGKGSVNPNDVKSYLASKGLSKNHVAGMLANIKAESSFRPGAIGDNGTSGGLFQHHKERFKAMVAYCGPNWATNWKGQIDFALTEPAGRQYAAMNFASPEAASKWFTINFERPANMVAKANTRSQDASQFA